MRANQRVDRDDQRKKIHYTSTAFLNQFRQERLIFFGKIYTIIIIYNKSLFRYFDSSQNFVVINKLLRNFESTLFNLYPHFQHFQYLSFWFLYFSLIFFNPSWPLHWLLMSIFVKHKRFLKFLSDVKMKISRLIRLNGPSSMSLQNLV